MEIEVDARGSRTLDICKELPRRKRGATTLLPRLRGTKGEPDVLLFIREEGEGNGRSSGGMLQAGGTRRKERKSLLNQGGRRRVLTARSKLR